MTAKPKGNHNTESQPAMTSNNNRLAKVRVSFKWSHSRAAMTYGYLVCRCYADGVRMAGCNGGGYDLRGTAFGDYVARAFANELRTRIKTPMAGLTFHNPKHDPGATKLPGGKTVAEAEAAGESLGLDRYQAIHSASSPLPTALHTVPMIDGACGFDSVCRIVRAIGCAIDPDLTEKRGRGGEINHYVIVRPSDDSGAVRWALTVMGKNGLRVIAGPNQGRNFHDDRRSAVAYMDAVTGNNSADTIREVYGDKPAFEVRPVECWVMRDDNGPTGAIGDARGVYFDDPRNVA
jgi:hypothetical protein